MNRPDKIRIMSVDIGIKFYPEEDFDAYHDLGWFSPKQQMIGLCENDNPTKLAATFLHEVLHAIFWLTGGYETMKNCDTEEINEIIATTFSTGLQTVVTQNPEVFAWYMSLIEQPSKLFTEPLTVSFPTNEQ